MDIRNIELENIPITRFKREGRKVARSIKKNACHGYRVTRKGKVVSYLVSPGVYEQAVEASGHDWYLRHSSAAD
mgnify:FL=1